MVLPISLILDLHNDLKKNIIQPKKVIKQDSPSFADILANAVNEAASFDINNKK